jgi:tRNA pseudouridine synthase 10
VREVTRKVLGLSEPLCTECSGRFFGKLGHGMSNPERWEILQSNLQETLPAPLPTPSECAICGGAFARIDAWVERALRVVEGYEWSTFLCGSRWGPENLATEEALWATTGSKWGESLRTAFNREFGKALARATGKVALQEGSEILLLADVPAGRVESTVFSLYFRGRYRKLDRTIPQTRWPCRVCRGRGCKRCEGTGKMYPTSVEELTAGPLTELAQGNGHRFHGMGREDIDARMLGRGRPFVAEVLSPKVRTLDVAAALQEINTRAEGRIEITELAPCAALDVRKVKEELHDKSYRVVVRGEVPEEKIKEALNLLSGCELVQRTPVRVAHRRADLMRHRKIREMKMTEKEGQLFTVEVRAEAGTYIKELVTGDGGRTQPNLSELVGTPLEVVSLDVLEIHDNVEGEPW